MALSMHQASVPILTAQLKSLLRILDKMHAFCLARKVDESVLLDARLAPDMYPLTTQVKIACDVAKFCVARLAFLEAPKHDDTEKTLAELKERVEQTCQFIESVPASKIDGSEEKIIEFVAGRHQNKRCFTGQAYLSTWVFPNFFFHVSMVYAILRHNGVELGKADYLGL